MTRRLAVSYLAGLLLAASPSRHLTAQTPADSAAIKATALDYIDGYYTGDAARMERALHPDLAKRIVNTDQNGRSRLGQMSAMSLVQGTRAGGGKDEANKREDVRILDIFQNTASVRIDAGTWVDYLHVAKWNGRWVIVNVLWELRR
ncbi:MAG TPA: nuclear transport factor 2 family protein [Gemmatimonadales bacterium]|nr:nuclear transport factor 2 family protein [Gemmatimonadales bacterium]